MLAGVEQLGQFYNRTLERGGQAARAAAGKLIHPVGQVYYHAIGIKKEYPEFNPLAAGILTLKAVHYTRTHHTVFEGYPVPGTGAAIFTGNHRDDNDIYKILQASRRTGGRMIRTVVKLGLVEDFTESREYLESIEATDDSFGYHPFKAFVMRGVGVNPVNREKPDGGFFKRCFRVIKARQLLGMFMQPHRYSDCYLRHLQPGVAFVAMQYPDIPVYPLAFSGPPEESDKITILKPLTYNENVKELGRKPGIAEFTVIIADRIVKALPKSSQLDWETRRAVEFERLIAITEKGSASPK